MQKACSSSRKITYAKSYQADLTALAASFTLIRAATNITSKCRIASIELQSERAGFVLTGDPRLRSRPLYRLLLNRSPLNSRVWPIAG